MNAMLRSTLLMFLVFTSSTLAQNKLTPQQSGHFNLAILGAPSTERSPSGDVYHAVRLSIATTDKGENVLEVNPDQIQVVDAAGHVYTAAAMDIGNKPKPGYVATAAIRSADGQIEFDIRGHKQMSYAVAKVQGVPKWTIRVLGEDSDTLCVLFKTAPNTALKQLLWPGLKPFPLPQQK